jgi:photosystem II stability/assembly factor-like uncharacterized protein
VSLVVAGSKSPIAVLFVFLFTLIFVPAGFAADWIPLGPEGGDARSLAADPSNPDRVYLGTSAGDVFVSTDAGGSWTRFAHLGDGLDYVLDNIVIDPNDPKTIYVGAWSIENRGGDVFKTNDGGKTWQALADMHGKSVRALAIAPSDPKVLSAGALDGVFRSTDAGATWQRFSPEGHAEIKNVESLAFDPKSVNVLYAGTWHLPWKTEDGGRTWDSIKQGIIVDSDVFSIIVDQRNPSIVYASACSGIYKSENAGKDFHKVQGIPFAARRTRVLQQDPVNGNVVYAGTTEGLWRTNDAGATWARISSPSLVINDVLIDPRNPQRVLVATDRTGVLLSTQGGENLNASNRGFAHRQVTAVVSDSSEPGRLYAALTNNREYGAIYRSDDNGANWSSLSSGLGGRDVFSLNQTDTGALIAGTNQGVFTLERGATIWKPMSIVLTEKVTKIPLRNTKKGAPKTRERREWIKTDISGRVPDIKISPGVWFAATSQGFYRSLDGGRSWTGGELLGHRNFLAVDALKKTVLVGMANGLVLSNDGGQSWNELKLPLFVERLFSVAVENDHHFWILTRNGAFRTRDAGSTWEHVMVGWPLTNISYLGYDTQGARLLAIGDSRSKIFESHDGGDTWKLTAQSHYAIRNVAVTRGRILAVTEFNGVIAQPGPEALPGSLPGGGN